MESILKPFALLEEQAGAGTGTWLLCDGPRLSVVSPIDGRQFGVIRSAGKDDYNAVIFCAAEAFKTWRTVPAPRRGEIVRQIGEALRLHKKELGALVSLETGKIRAEIGGDFGGEKKPGAVANPVPTPGRLTCGARPALSTGPASCRWRRRLDSPSGEPRHCQTGEKERRW